MRTRTVTVPHPAPLEAGHSKKVFFVCFLAPVLVIAAGAVLGRPLERIIGAGFFVAIVAFVLGAWKIIAHKAPLDKTGDQVLVLGHTLTSGIGELTVNLDGEVRTNRSSDGHSKYRAYFYSVSYAAHGRFVLLCNEANSAPRVRVFVEALAKLGRWPIVWKSGGSEERREAEKLDLSLAQRLQVVGPPVVVGPVGSNASFKEELKANGVVLTQRASGLRTLWIALTLATLFAAATVVLKSSAGTGWLILLFFAAASWLFLSLGVPAKTWMPSQVEINTKGVSTRYCLFGGPTLFQRFTPSSRIESVMAERVLMRTRVLLVGDDTFRALRLPLHAMDLGRVAYLIQVGLAGMKPETRPSTQPSTQPRKADAAQSVSSAQYSVDMTASGEAKSAGGACPRCATVALSAPAGPLEEEACFQCGGRFISPGGVEQLVHQQLGITKATLRELLGYFAGKKLRCPSCSSSTSPVRIASVDADLCTGCGGLWLDRGELSVMSAGEQEG